MHKTRNRQSDKGEKGKEIKHGQENRDRGKTTVSANFSLKRNLITNNLAVELFRGVTSNKSTSK